MKTPAFWYQSSSSLCGHLLSPLSSVYRFFARSHQNQSVPQTVTAPVICVGNIVAGGSGKTPTTMALLQLLQDRQISLSPSIVTRGYKGHIEGPERVDRFHSPILWGDEALLLAEHAPTIVSKNRYKGAQYAVETGADLIVLDDGLQNYSLTRDIGFCVIDGMMGFGNGRVIPAGPLRQTLEDALPSIDAFILIGEDMRNVEDLLPQDKPVFTARIVPRPDADPRYMGPYVGFCGIGYPEKFKQTISKNGFELTDFIAFPDHHAYTDTDLSRLVERAMDLKSRLLTTEKDFVRIADFPKKSLIDVLAVDLVFDAPEKLAGFIQTKLARHIST